MGAFERYLSLWVAGAIALGVAAGSLAPDVFAWLSELEIFRVNIVVAVLIWLMIYPMMLKIEPVRLASIGTSPRGLVLTIVVNWLIKPFTMAALALLFFETIFVDLVDPETAQEYIAGMILLGVAPCTAMVFVWSNLTRGDANYTLMQVSVNDVILVFAFAPIAGLLLGVSGLTVPWSTLLLSVAIFLVLPLIAGIATRKTFLKRSESRKAGDIAIADFARRIKPLSIVALLLTVSLLFGFQAPVILERPDQVGLIAVPLLIQSYGIFFVAYIAAKVLKLRHDVAAPAALIGTSNFFELAVAVSISLFGLGSGAALATVVGVLIEVPVMLSLVAFANRTHKWFPVTEGAS